jgi:hypothetical protein
VHWASLPKRFKDAIWREYRPGQERDKKPSVRYLAVQQAAVAMAAFKPYDEGAAKTCAEYLQKAIHLQHVAIQAGDGDPLQGLWVEGAFTGGPP